jgi:hypothetical protein
MATPSAVTGQELLSLLGMASISPPVQTSLTQLARGMQPELDPEDEASLVDWVTVNEIGLEFGFEDEAYVLALEVDKRRQGRLLLTELYFYGDTPKTMPFPYPLPFGLTFEDDRAAVRRKLAAHEGSRRSYVRDTWSLPDFNVTVAYHADSGRLESVFCYVRYAPWPALEGEAQRVAGFTPDVFADLFGLRWSSAALRDRLAPLGFDGALSDVRTEQTAYLRVAHGIDFGFAPSREIAAADPQFPRSLALASVTYYASRVLDAREWVGSMPFGVAFVDSQVDLAAKLVRPPDEREDEDRTGFVVWHFERYSLQVEYSNIENRLLRVTMMAPGYWAASGAAGDNE